MNQYTLLALLAILSTGLSCSGAILKREDPGVRQAKIPTEAEWIRRVLESTEKNVELIEASTVLASKLTGVERPYSTILSVLDASIRKAKEKTQGPASGEEKIRALNEFVLPAINASLKQELSWLRDAYASELGPCVPHSLLYLVAADALALPLELVSPPGHVYLRYTGEGRKRNIEATDVGQDLSEAEYLERLAKLPSPTTPLPGEMKDATGFFTAVSRRQFVAELLVCRASKGPPDSRERDLVTATRIAPDLALAHRQLAMHYVRLSKSELGEECFSRAIELAPRWPALLQLRGVLRAHSGQLKSGLEDIEQAIRYAPRSVDLQNVRATILTKLGRVQDAIETWSTSIQLQPGQVDALRKRAYLYQAVSKEYTKAIADLTEVIAKGKPEPSDYHARGVCQGRIGDLDRSLDDLTKATVASPDDATFWRDRGITQANMKRHAPAVEDLSKAIKLDPSNAALYEFRARCYASLGDEARWDADFKKAKELRAKPKE